MVRVNEFEEALKSSKMSSEDRQSLLREIEAFLVVQGDSLFLLSHLLRFGPSVRSALDQEKEEGRPNAIPFRPPYPLPTRDYGPN